MIVEIKLTDTIYVVANANSLTRSEEDRAREIIDAMRHDVRNKDR